ncbi:MAG: hypothetical protein MPW14_09955 [Candidatus Manganitrophus sp.]|nr:MAG: hypothetical protein MPW14_09955 [Candidatus Manganitrophus sp.]
MDDRRRGGRPGRIGPLPFHRKFFLRGAFRAGPLPAGAGGTFFLQPLPLRIGELAGRFVRHPHHRFGDPVGLPFIAVAGSADGELRLKPQGGLISDPLLQVEERSEVIFGNGGVLSGPAGWEDVFF